MTKPARKEPVDEIGVSAIGETTSRHLDAVNELERLLGPDPDKIEGGPSKATNSFRARIDSGEIRVTGLAKKHRKYRAQTSLEQIAAKKNSDGEPRLTYHQVQAGHQLYTHFVSAGLHGSPASLDLAKEVWCVSDSQLDEAEFYTDHHKKWTAACRVISKVYSYPMLQIILYDATLTEAGNMMGIKGKDAGSAALPLLRDTLQRLAEHFGFPVLDTPE